MTASLRPPRQHPLYRRCYEIKKRAATLSWLNRTGRVLGARGLSLSAAYVRGSGIDGSHVGPRGGYAYLGYGEGGRHWERDLMLQYRVAESPAKGLRLALEGLLGGTF